MEKLVAELSSVTNESMRLHRHLFEEVARVDVLVAAECDCRNLVARPSVHVVNQVNAGVVILRISGYLGVEVALALKEVDQILTALFHQIGINGALGEDRDEFLHLPSTKEWKP